MMGHTLSLGLILDCVIYVVIYFQARLRTQRYAGVNGVFIRLIDISSRFHKNDNIRSTSRNMDGVKFLTFDEIPLIAWEASVPQIPVLSELCVVSLLRITAGVEGEQTVLVSSSGRPDKQLTTLTRVPSLCISSRSRHRSSVAVDIKQKLKDYSSVILGISVNFSFRHHKMQFQTFHLNYLNTMAISTRRT